MAVMIPRKTNTIAPKTVTTAPTAQKGIYVSAGLYRDPKTKQLYKSKTGALPTATPNAEPKTNPVVNNPAPTPTPEPTPEFAPKGEPNPDYLPIMFPDTNVNSYLGDVKQSPLYNFRLGEGQKALSRKLAAMGLSNSGADIQANADLVNKLSAEEGDRQLTTAQNQIQNNLTRGGSFQNFLTSEANRRDMNSNEQFSRLYQIMSLAANQNPMNTGADAANSSAKMTTDFNNTLSDLIKNSYTRVSAGGGGGGGQSIPGFQPIAPSGPDMTEANLVRIIGGGANNSNYLNALTSLLT